MAKVIRGQPTSSQFAAVNPMAMGEDADYGEIELEPEETTNSGVTYLPDGSIEIEDEQEELSGIPPENFTNHNANLAIGMKDTDLAAIASTIIRMVESDLEARKPWEKRAKRGMDAIGITTENNDELPFRGASTVVHPMISEAIIQFNARAMAEILPPTGPVKIILEGEPTKEELDRADRIESHMNYQITIEDDSYFDETDQMLFDMPTFGCAFKKTYFDTLTGRVTSRFIKADNVIIPYTATSIKTAPRITVRSEVDKNDMAKYQSSGFYRDVELSQPSSVGRDDSDSDLREARDENEGKEKVLWDDDAPFLVYESCIHWDLPGYEDSDENGEETGIALPYVITVEKESSAVLSIRRNWKKNDALRNPRRWLTQYKFLPGTGVYGFGWYHIIGGLSDTASGTMRALLDSAAFATMQGGFKSSDARLPSGQIELEPGVWKDVDLTAEELQRAFYTPPFKEPSRALFEMFQAVENSSRRFLGTTEAVVGDAKNTGPVGTTVALIEQGTKVMSGIHRRLHNSQGEELRIRFELNSIHAPQTPFSYIINGKRKFISIADYANGNVRPVPVSDPNITSVTQRIALAQGKLELSERAPELYNKYRVHYQLLQAMGVDDIDWVLKDPAHAKRCDPAKEGANVMTGKPIKAYYDQDHQSHIAVHNAQMQIFARHQDPNRASMLSQAMMAHIAEHEACMLYQQFTMGAMQPIDLSSEDEVPAQIENMIAPRQAQIAMQVGQAIAANQPEPAEDSVAKANIGRMNAAHQAEEVRLQKSFDADQNRKAIAFEKDQHRRNARNTFDTAREAKRDVVKEEIKQKAKKNAAPQ